MATTAKEKASNAIAKVVEKLLKGKASVDEKVRMRIKFEIIPICAIHSDHKCSEANLFVVIFVQTDKVVILDDIRKQEAEERKHENKAGAEAEGSKET